MYFGHLLAFPDVKLGFKYGFGLSSFVKIKKLLSHHCSVSHVHNGISGFGSFFK